MPRILAIEDERDIGEILDYNLRQAGHEVILARTGQEGLRLAREKRPQLVLLDLMLPDVPGAKVCKAIKQDLHLRSTLVVILTAKTDEADRILGFEVGADDYVVKPFSVRELVLRVGAILRRVATPKVLPRAFEFASLKVDRSAHRVWVNAEEAALTVREFQLLVALYDQRNRVQSREALLQEVWGPDADFTTRTVDTHIRRLRSKLGVASEYIETVRGGGYRFAADDS